MLFLLIIAYTGFIKSSIPAGSQTNAVEDALRILAPYETRAHREAILELAEDYSAVSGHKKVQVEFISGENYKKEIGMRLDMGDNADIIICDNVIMPALIDMNVFADISSRLYPGNTAPYYPNLWENTKNNGKVYGMPFTVDPYVLFYNKDLLEKYHELPPQTWEDLTRVCDSVESGLGNYGLGLATKYPEEATASYMQLLYAAGGTLRELNGESGLRALGLLRELGKRHQIPEDAINWSGRDLSYMFVKGNIAMMVNKMSNAEILRSAGVSFEVGVKELPMDKKYANLLCGENIGITATADYSSALDFLLYLGNEEVAAKVADGLDTIPVLIQAPYCRKAMALSEKEAADEILCGVTRSSYGSWFDISAAVSDGLYQILSKPDTSVKQTADAMQDKVRMAIIDQ